MRAESKVYAGLTVSCTAGDVEFVEGAAEVTDAQAAALRKLPESFGVTVEGGVEAPAADPAKSDGKLDRPAGNGSLEAWAAYAAQEGHDVTDLKQSEIRALFSE